MHTACMCIHLYIMHTSLVHKPPVYLIRSPKAVVHTLAPREMLNYTWDDPEGKKVICWNFPSVAKIHNRKPIEIIKVNIIPPACYQFPEVVIYVSL